MESSLLGSEVHQRLLVPSDYVGILLFTLGIYSVYSFSIVWSSVSLRVAVILGLVLTLFGLVAGGLAEWVYQSELSSMSESLDLLK